MPLSAQPCISLHCHQKQEPAPLSGCFSLIPSLEPASSVHTSIQQTTSCNWLEWKLTLLASQVNSQLHQFPDPDRWIAVWLLLLVTRKGGRNNSLRGGREIKSLAALMMYVRLNWLWNKGVRERIKHRNVQADYHSYQGLWQFLH